MILPFALIACGGEETEETTDAANEETTEVVEEVEETEVNNERKSPRVNQSWAMNDLEVSMDYGSPRVRDREVWGELVAYDEVWRAGADEATSITFGSDVTINGNAVAAGTYGLFIIPKADADWTFILNEEWSKEEHDVWGAYDYKEDKDVLRWDVPVQWKDESLEEMTFNFIDGMLTFEWEKAHCEFEILLAPEA